MMSVRAPGLRGILGNNRAAASLGIQVASVGKEIRNQAYILDPAASLHAVCMYICGSAGMGWPNGPCVHLGPAGS